MSSSPRAERACVSTAVRRARVLRAAAFQCFSLAFNPAISSSALPPLMRSAMVLSRVSMDGGLVEKVVISSEPFSSAEKAWMLPCASAMKVRLPCQSIAAAVGRAGSLISRSMLKSAFQSLTVLSRPAVMKEPFPANAKAVTPPGWASIFFTSPPLFISQKRTEPSSEAVARRFESERKASAVIAD